LLEHLRTQIKHLDHAGLFQRELMIGSAQGPRISIAGQSFVNFTSSDYLGFANHPEVRAAAAQAIETWGIGLATPRMTAGTLIVHAQLEQAIAQLLGADDALVTAGAGDAHLGLFEALLGHRDCVFSDEQIGPSLADGLRLSRARVYAYRHQDLSHLEDLLKRSRAARHRLIVTDGVFPLSGLPAQLADLYALAERYDALVVVDDSQGIGVLGESGRGTHDHAGAKRVDVVTGSFGCALGGGGGGFVAGRNDVITWLRQKSRPHLAAPALDPAAAAAALKSIELLRRGAELVARLRANVRLFRDLLANNGLWTTQGDHPAVAVLIRRSSLTQQLVDQLYEKRVLAVGFCPPIVPEGASRIRMQVTALHEVKDLQHAVGALTVAAGELAIPRERPRDK
jgi:glycine C-acetyltransferase